MRLRFPLSFKIVAWFFVNLLVLTCGLALLFSAKIGFDSVLSSLVKTPAQTVGDLVAQELNAQPSVSWTNVLHRFDGAYGMHFALFHNEGRQKAGMPLELPQRVLERMREVTHYGTQEEGPGPEGRPPGRGPEGEPPPLEDDRRPPPPDILGQPRDFGGPPDFRVPPPLPPGERPPFDPRPRPRMENRVAPVFVMSTSSPTAYWAGVGIPVFDPVEGTPMPVMLVMRGDALGGGGFFFDPKPWVIAGFGAVLVSVLLWFPLVRGVTQSLRKVTAATVKIAEGDFDVRVPERRNDELGTLGASVNVMAEKLAGFVHGQKRFLGDIAHELCSPLSRMQAAMGIMEQQTQDPAQVRNVGRMNRELQHMSELVNELLSFSKANLRRDIEVQPLRLAPLVRKAVERECAASDRLCLNIPESTSVLAEPELLVRAIGNVLRNSLRYATDSGPIEVDAQLFGEEVVVRIRDHGPGVPPESLSRLFDAFYRPDLARNRETGGVGLGLAIVKSCVEACHGRVSVANASPQGLEVTFRLVNGGVAG